MEASYGDGGERWTCFRTHNWESWIKDKTVHEGTTQFILFTKEWTGHKVLGRPPSVNFEGFFFFLLKNLHGVIFYVYLWGKGQVNKFFYSYDVKKKKVYPEALPLLLLHLLIYFEQIRDCFIL